MRLSFLALAFATALTTVASATEPMNARTVFVERRGLVEADTRCQLFRSDIRAALMVSLAQARGALLREGWTNARLTQLDEAVVTAARGRACNDTRTTTSAANVRRVYGSWANAGTMQFPGWDRSWTARRSARQNGGWRLSQAIDAPTPALFGVRDRDGGQHLSLVIALERGQTAPASAQLVLRDTARARLVEVALPQRMAMGLEAGLPAPSAAIALPSTRTIERIDGGRSQVVFTFPDTAFAQLLALDPRESVEVRLQNGRVAQRLVVEVGDVAAARAFLTIR